MSCHGPNDTVCAFCGLGGGSVKSLPVKQEASVKRLEKPYVLVNDRMSFKQVRKAIERKLTQKKRHEFQQKLYTSKSMNRLIEVGEQFVSLDVRRESPKPKNPIPW